MPRAKPTHVVIHRVELQEKEREMLEAYIGGTVVKNAVIPGAVLAGVGAASYIGYKTAKGLVGWTEDALDDLKQEFNEVKEKAEKAGDVAGAAFKLTPFGRAMRGVQFLFTGK